jgi:hypothetical protein
MKWPSHPLIGTLIGTILGRLLLGLPHGITISAQVRSFVKKPLFFMGLQVLWAVFYVVGMTKIIFLSPKLLWTTKRLHTGAALS